MSTAGLLFVVEYSFSSVMLGSVVIVTPNLVETCFTESACVKSNPCQNGGWCSAAPWREKKFICYCKEFYIGENCTRGMTKCYFCILLQ